jgi:hypothetical protein
MSTTKQAGITPADKAECVRLVLEYGESMLKIRCQNQLDRYMKAQHELSEFAVALATKARETT